MQGQSTGLAESPPATTASLVADVTTETVGAVDVFAGGDTSCALLISGAMRCWGRNERGQLGLPRGAPRTPTNVRPFGTTWQAARFELAPGVLTRCALFDAERDRRIARDTQLWCWGPNGDSMNHDPSLLGAGVPDPGHDPSGPVMEEP